MNSIDVPGRALLITPDPNKSIAAQASKTLIKNLPDPRVLKNEYFELYIGTTDKPVYAKSNGTYYYSCRDPEFAALSVFLTLSSQMDLYLGLGLRQPERPLIVVVNDPSPSVANNAYFDPEHYEIHIGIGTGVKHGGLNKNIAFDLGVTNHEFGHTIVYLQTAGNELPGAQGAAINEALGDVLGTLVMDYMRRIWYEKQFGQPFTAYDLKNDPRIIGKYALSPFGIRTQKTSKKTPDDLSGEPHADGLIIGSALADLLVAMGTMQNTVIEPQIKQFTQIILVALTLIPDFVVTFKDMLRAVIAADQLIYAGRYRLLIEQCFAAHGITFNTINQTESPCLKRYPVV